MASSTARVESVSRNRSTKTVPTQARTTREVSSGELPMIEISLHVGQYLVTRVAIDASSPPPTYRLALHYGMTMRFDVKDMDEVMTVPEKIAIFERMDYTLHYYLVDVQ